MAGYVGHADRRLILYRVQDQAGRGPWRPGFSRQWVEPSDEAGRLMETLMDLLPFEAIQMLPEHLHYGCACRTKASLLAWFLPPEIRRLQAFGYRIVRMQVDAVLAESQWQVFFARRRPLAEGATVIRW